MKIFIPAWKITPRAGRKGFTLAEMMVTMLVFSFVVLAIISLQLFATRTYTLGATMLSATSGGRAIMNDIRDKIRAAKIVMVGTYGTTNGSIFIQAPIGALQRGNALELEFTNAADTNFLIYYQNSAATNICSFSNSVATAYTNTTKSVVANYVTNYYCFSAENYQGSIETNYQNNPVIHITLQFYQWQFPIGIIGGNAVNSYNFYNLNSSIARRDKD